MQNNEVTPAPQNNVVPQYESLTKNFDDALAVVDDIVLKNYISKLDTMSIVPLDSKIKEMKLANFIRLFKITEMVYEKDEFSTYKFASVFNTLASQESAVFIMIDGHKDKTDFYMGVRSFDPDKTIFSLYSTLENALKGQFPGICISPVDDEKKLAEILDGIKSNHISSVSGVANSRDSDIRDNKSFIQGLEKLALAMQGTEYTGIILANSCSQSQLVDVRTEYEKIYTQLFPFLNAQISYGSESSVSASTSLSKGTSQTITEGWNSSTSRSDSISHPTNQGKAGSILSGALTVAGTIIGTLVNPGLGTIAGGSIGGALGGSVAGVMQETENITNSTQFGKSGSTTNGVSEGITDTQTIGRSSSQNLQISTQNRKIKSTLDRIDLQLKRLQEFESLGMWECAAYFTSDDAYAAEIAASTYKALMRGENSGVEVCAINSWHDYIDKTTGVNKIGPLRDYLTHFIHPVFAYQGNERTQAAIEVTPCSLVSGNELAIHMGLPRHSVCGFPVIEHTDFGKEVNYVDRRVPNAIVRLGNVFSMGQESTTPVRLDRNSFSMHTFITGSTGSGKSNTVYELLKQFYGVGIHFMVIEPAKGEYKNVFGNRADVTVLGTNPSYSQLLQINPFRFPPQIHVLEHIDRLVEIFNVCWPMYAAMPAVLKEALLQAYRVCGWDLTDSRNTISNELFPTFQDLQAELVDVIENSAYSQEVKSNYMGSLATRINSLTNGLNGQIFSANEIDSGTLFDTNVIVDLSRIGSLETKSLIMGILVMRLGEHRMSSSSGMNTPLKHITVLEEAHNILKRTSSEQNPENPSVTGKSVEMLSNAIAEMRTYGEGFIIADQSPSAVDLSAIRNTNTKIIMRLPDEADRRLAGKSAALKDEQLDEIAKLPKGVAVVYQNDWLEPVLCKVNKFSGKEELYSFDKNSYQDLHFKCDVCWFNHEMLKLLLHNRLPQPPQIDVDRLLSELPYAPLSTKNKLGITRLLNEYRASKTLKVWDENEFSKLSKMVVELLDCKIKVEKLIQTVADFDELNFAFSEIVRRSAEPVTDELSLATAQCFMKDFSMEHPDGLNIYASWRKHLQ